MAVLWYIDFSNCLDKLIPICEGSKLSNDSNDSDKKPDPAFLQNEVSVGLLGIVLNLGLSKLTDINPSIEILKKITDVKTILDVILVGSVGIGYIIYILCLAIAAFNLIRKKSVIEPLSYSLAIYFGIYVILLFSGLNSSLIQNQTTTTNETLFSSGVNEIASASNQVASNNVIGETDTPAKKSAKKQ